MTEKGWAVAWADTFADAKQIHHDLHLSLCDDIYDAQDKAAFFAAIPGARPKVFWVVRNT